MKPFDYQEPHIQHMMEVFLDKGIVLDASSTGVGKTFCSLELVRRLGYSPAIVCPAVAKHGWADHCEKMGLEPVFIESYAKMRGGKTTWVKKRGKKAFKWDIPDHAVLIFDEVHKTAQYKSLTSHLVRHALQQDFAAILLSATLADNPLKLRSLGPFLGLFARKHWDRFAITYGCHVSYFNRFAFEWTSDIEDQRHHMNQLHQQIFPTWGSRLRKEDIAGFPETVIEGKLLHTNGVRDLNKVLEENKLLRKKLSISVSSGAGDLEVYGYQRQVLELARIKPMLAWTQEYVTGGHSVVMFVNFRASLQWLVEKLLVAKIPICTIHGDQTDVQRGDALTRFARDEARVCICMVQAGGIAVNLQDRVGKYPRVSLISPMYSSTELKQVLGRVHRADSATKSLQYICYLAGTLEEEVYNNVTSKLKNLDCLNDGDLQYGEDHE